MISLGCKLVTVSYHFPMRRCCQIRRKLFQSFSLAMKLSHWKRIYSGHIPARIWIIIKECSTIDYPEPEERSRTHLVYWRQSGAFLDGLSVYQWRAQIKWSKPAVAFTIICATLQLMMLWKTWITKTEWVKYYQAPGERLLALDCRTCTDIQLGAQLLQHLSDRLTILLC